MTKSHGNPFWTYSLALYGRAEVAGACLALQNRLGLDVNLLLFCCWAASRGRGLRPDEIERLIAATGSWRDEVVQPLRQARRWLKTPAPELGPAALALRADIEAAELAAEAIQQELMHKTLLLPAGSPSPTAGAANLRAYLGARGYRIADAANSADLATILCAAFPDLASPEARRLLAV